eukprot:3173929-Rhodomonas_salina.1
MQTTKLEGASTLTATRLSSADTTRVKKPRNAFWSSQKICSNSSTGFSTRKWHPNIRMKWNARPRFTADNSHRGLSSPLSPCSAQSA